MNKTTIKLFETKQVRTAWNEDEEEWYFSIVDVVGILTESINPTDYLKKLRKRDELLGEYIGTNCPQVEMLTESGKIRKTLAASTKDLFRIIQSIPSPKAEPFKQWMAQVAKERLDQLQDPERSIEQAMTDYRRLGYSENWINQRLKSIEIRKDLTDDPNFPLSKFRKPPILKLLPTALKQLLRAEKSPVMPVVNWN